MITTPTLLITILLCMLIFAVPRRYVLSIYIFGMCFVPAEQAVVIAGLDFKVLRIFALVGILRIFIKNEQIPIRLNKMDKLVIAWCIVGTIAFTLNLGTFGAFVNRLGRVVDILFLYYVFRIMVRDFKDIQMIFKSLILCAAALLPFVLIEFLTGRNSFMVLGRQEISYREGRIRASAAFSHAILLGSFSAAVLPLALMMSKKAVEKSFKSRKLWFLCVGALLFITVASASSGPLLAMLAGLFVTFCYKYRRYVGTVTYGIMGLLFCLHLVMNKPVWHLAARIDFTGGSTGWHRYNLINLTIENFGDWFLVGTNKAQVIAWGVFAGDVTSMYILQGIQGGILTFIFFSILIVVMCRIFWKLSIEKLPKRESLMIWAIFSSAMAHVTSFLSVAYFGQIQMMLILWFALAAYLITYHGQFRREKREERLKKQLEKANGEQVDDG